METVNDVGLKGALRRGEYRRQVVRARAHISGVLAIGYRTPGWLIERGMSAERVYRFTYFLDAPSLWVLDPSPLLLTQVTPCGYSSLGSSSDSRGWTCYSTRWAQADG